MSLHKITELIRRFGIYVGIGIGGIFIIFLIFQAGAFLKNIISPPKIAPPNQKFGELPSLQFPESEIGSNFAYQLNTVSGQLPRFNDRINVYKIVKPEPSLLNLEKAKEKAKSLKFTDSKRNALPEISLGNGEYQWNELGNLNRRLKLNIVSFDFSLSSNYLSQLSVLGVENLSDENNAIQTVQEFLTSIEMLPEDIDISKTQTPQKDIHYLTYPQLFTVTSGTLIPTSSLSGAKVIRVDLYQKDMVYEIDTGKKGAKKIKVNTPILYPHPPYSTMSFWVASGQNKAEVYQAEFLHREIATDEIATYPIKTADTAFDELKNGEAYVASYSGLEKDIQINNVFLAYYFGDANQEYLMPIIVFEGQDNFFAYVSAIKR